MICMTAVAVQSAILLCVPHALAAFRLIPVCAAVFNADSIADIQIGHIVLHDCLITAVVQTHANLICGSGVLLTPLGDFVAGHSACDGGCSLAAAAANLMAEQAAYHPADNRAAYAAAAGRRIRHLDRVDYTIAGACGLSGGGRLGDRCGRRGAHAAATGERAADNQCCE